MRMITLYSVRLNLTKIHTDTKRAFNTLTLCQVQVQLAEGRNRVVRRMFHALGLPLRQLHREAIGPLSCAKLALAPGEVTSVPASEAKRREQRWEMTSQKKGEQLESW